MSILAFSCSIFAQYDGNKLPSGLTLSTTVADNDYTIIQKNGEVIVKAVRMDTLQSYMTAGMTGAITELDSVSGSTGQFIISDGLGWLAPVSAKYEGTDAYTFGSRLSGAIGSGSIVLGRGRATGARSFAINGVTASGTDAVAINGGTASGNSTIAMNGGVSSGNNSMSMNGGASSGNNSISMNGGVAEGYLSIAIIGGESYGSASFAVNSGASYGSNSVAMNGSRAYGDNSTAINGSIAYGDNSMSIGVDAFTTSYQEFVIGQYNDTATTSTRDSWVVTDRLFTIGNGTSGNESNALVMLKNGNTTANGSWKFNGNITADTITGYIETENTFAEIYYADGSTAQSIPTGTTYTKLTPYTTNGESANCTADAANDKITITHTGYYLVQANFSRSCGTNAVTARTAIFLGGVEQDKLHDAQIYTTSTNVQSGTVTGIIKVETVPVDLDVRIRHNNVGSINFTGIYGNLNVHKISEL